MLSDDALENLIRPIMQRQENINNYVVGLIAERIKKIGTVNASDVSKIYELMNIGGDMRFIQKAIASAAKMNESEVKSILYEAADSMYGDAEKFYTYRGLPYVPLSDAISAETVETFENLSNTTGFISWVNGEKVPLTIRDAYTQIVDEAIQAVKGNVTDYNSAIRHSMKQLIDSGVRSFGYDADPNSSQFGRTFVTYAPESGRRYTRRLDSAVKQNILDGVKAINQRMQDAIGDQIGADGKEISVHRFPAPDHAPVQGHVFTESEYDKLQNDEESEDVNGRQFPPMERAIGMWNCKHFTFSIIIGVFPPNYTQEQLDKILEENEKGLVYEDKHYTGYQCTQLQRKYELEIRRAKDGYIAAEKLGDDKLKEEYHGRVNSLMTEYQNFNEKSGLNFKYSNIYVNGYNP